MMNNSKQKEIYNDLGKSELIKLLLKADHDLLLKNQEVEQLKTSFLSNISHEVRTPMNAIMGFSGLLKDEDISKEDRNFFLDSISSGSEKLLSIIDNIIEAAQIETNLIKKKDEAFSVNEFLENIYNSYATSKKFNEKKNISLKLKLKSDHNPFIITDSRLLERILINIIDNAYKFTEEGSIEFGYNLINGARIQFFVFDTGIGIPSDKCDIIFDQFRQIDDGLSKKHDGLGMGLTISKKLAELIDGEFDIVSEPGVGTKLYLSLLIKAIPSSPELPFSPIKHPIWLSEIVGTPKFQTECNKPNWKFFHDLQNFSA